MCAIASGMEARVATEGRPRSPSIVRALIDASIRSALQMKQTATWRTATPNGGKRQIVGKQSPILRPPRRTRISVFIDETRLPRT